MGAISILIIICAFLSAGLFAFFVYLVFLAKKKENAPFNFRQYFLYEALDNPSKKIVNWLHFLLGAITICNFLISLGMYFLPIDETITSKYYFLFFAVCNLATGIFLFLLFKLDFSREKMRVASLILFGAFISIMNGTSGFILLSISRKTSDKVALSLSSGVICFFLGLLSFLPLFNPKLNNYDKLVHVTEEDGSSHLERPKAFAMAYTEWFLFFVFEISTILECAFFMLVTL